MDIHNDKSLFKIIFVILIIAAIPIALKGLIYFGPKWLLFVLWLIIAFYLFCLELSKLLFGVATKDPRGFLSSLWNIGLGDLDFKLAAVFLLSLLILLSYGIWRLLGF